MITRKNIKYEDLVNTRRVSQADIQFILIQVNNENYSYYNYLSYKYLRHLCSKYNIYPVGTKKESIIKALEENRKQITSVDCSHFDTLLFSLLYASDPEKIKALSNKLSKFSDYALYDDIKDSDAIKRLQFSLSKRGFKISDVLGKELQISSTVYQILRNKREYLRANQMYKYWYNERKYENINKYVYDLIDSTDVICLKTTGRKRVIDLISELLTKKDIDLNKVVNVKNGIKLVIK